MEAGASCQVLGAARALVAEDGEIFLLMRTRKAEQLATDPALRGQQVIVIGDHLAAAKMLVVREFAPVT